MFSPWSLLFQSGSNWTIKGFLKLHKKTLQSIAMRGMQRFRLQQAETTFFFSRRTVNRSSFESNLLLEHKEKSLKMVTTESQINKLGNTGCTNVIINSFLLIILQGTSSSRVGVLYATQETVFKQPPAFLNHLSEGWAHLTHELQHPLHPLFCGLSIWLS